MIALPLSLMTNPTRLRALREHVQRPCERMAEVTIGCLAKWKYSNCFEFMTCSDKNIIVKCKLCPRGKKTTDPTTGTSNLLKHLSLQHCHVKLEAN